MLAKDPALGCLPLLMPGPKSPTGNRGKRCLLGRNRELRGEKLPSPLWIFHCLEHKGTTNKEFRGSENRPSLGPFVWLHWLKVHKPILSTASSQVQLCFSSTCLVPLCFFCTSRKALTLWQVIQKSHILPPQCLSPLTQSLLSSGLKTILDDEK